ncbi:SAG family member [Eimeria mitis]|uniref:SAG family member n=1 Tax=Eimeria mitis TaxID=44415 RepID=U6JUS8_9EIME|nr:SAG family member [Eimeria mitis]CDJ27817.1 SAG family member [Eimeria mitis]
MAALCVARSAVAETIPSAETATPVQCLGVFNEARVRAGFDPFTTEEGEQQKLPIDDPEYIKAVCKAMKEDGSVKSSHISYKREGTYAFASQTGETGDCSAALSHWSKALTYFGELPPVYTGDNAGSYASTRNRSFVALFNPMKSATIDCAYFICPTASTTIKTTLTADNSGTPTSNQGNGDKEGKTVSLQYAEDLAGRTAPLSPNSEETEQLEKQGGPQGSKTDPEEGIVTRRLETTAKDIRALVCLTNPQALVSGRRPFTLGSPFVCLSLPLPEQ